MATKSVNAEDLKAPDIHVLTQTSDISIMVGVTSLPCFSERLCVPREQPLLGTPPSFMIVFNLNCTLELPGNFIFNCDITKLS